MSVNYSVRLIDRANEGTYHTFARGDDIAKLSFGFTKPGGCAAFSMTGCLDDWSAVEALMVPENLVEIRADLGGGLSLAYTGIVQRVDGPKNTAPGRTNRKIAGYGLVAEIKKDGYLVFAAYEGSTIEEVAEDITETHIGRGVPPLPLNTDISTATTGITTTSDYTIPRTFFNDITGEECFKKLAMLHGGAEWGVDADRKVFFRDTNTATVLTLQLGDESSGVTMARHEISQPGPNALLVSGKEARQGNSMTVNETDIGTYERTRAAKLRAPSLIEGDDMVEWAQHKLAAEKDAPENITAKCRGIEDKTNSILTATGQVAMLDEDGGSIGTWPIKAVTYTLNDGCFDAKFELGDVFEPDPSERLRELLRNTAVLDEAAFMNQAEIDADTDGWGTTAQLLMADANHGIRNVVRYDFEGKLDLIDFDSTMTRGAKADRTEAGLTSQFGGDEAATFATFPIEMGKKYNQYAILRKCAYPVLIRDDAEGDLHKRFSWDAVACYGEELDEDWRVRWYHSIYGTSPNAVSEIRPFVRGTGIAHTYESTLQYTPQIIEGIDYKARFRWGEPAGGVGVILRHFIFRYQDPDNYAAVTMCKNGGDVVFWLRRILAGVDTSPIAAKTLAYTADDIFLLTVDCASYANLSEKVGMTLENETAETSSGPHWTGDAALDALPGTKCGFASRFIGANPGDNVNQWDDWGLRSLTFDNAVETGTMPGWQISRDGGTSLDSAEFNVDNGALQNLAAYSGGGTEQSSIIVRGTLLSPQILVKLAVGWKD